MPFVVLLLCAAAAIHEQKIYNEENEIICIIVICDSHVYVPYNSFTNAREAEMIMCVIYSSYERLIHYNNEENQYNYEFTANYRLHIIVQENR